MTQIVKIAEGDVQQTEAVQSFFTATAPANTPREALVDPVFWTHAARKLRPLSEIRVIAQDSSWYAHIFVMYSAGLDIKLHELGYWELGEIDAGVGAENSEFKVVWAGPTAKFRVIRKVDNVVMQSGFSDKNTAAVWLFRNSKNAA